MKGDPVPASLVVGSIVALTYRSRVRIGIVRRAGRTRVDVEFTTLSGSRLCPRLPWKNERPAVLPSGTVPCAFPAMPGEQPLYRAEVFPK